MQAIISEILASGYFDAIFLATIFFVALILFYAGYELLMPSIEVSRRASAAADGSAQMGVLVPHVGEIAENKLREAIESFYASLQEGDKDAISWRLIRAGFFSKSATKLFYIAKIAASTFAFFATFAGARILDETVSNFYVGLMAGAIAALVYILANFFLDYLGRKQGERYRRAFPDFMDMIIVCADAGLSLEAAVARVAQEMLETNREFGIHLSIMMLEVRAGKRLRDALSAFGDRLDLDEARSLATVFKQSEELGSSIIDTLRVFSDEMRRARITRAEEKANALPVKMVFPLGIFIFPVMLAVVAMPAILIVLKLLGGLGTPG